MQDVSKEWLDFRRNQFPAGSRIQTWELDDPRNTLKEARKLVQFFKDFTAGEYVKYSATASIGAAVFPENGSDFDSLYKAADKALYKAKQRGKNQLAFYDDRDRK